MKLFCFLNFYWLIVFMPGVSQARQTIIQIKMKAGHQSETAVLKGYRTWKDYLYGTPHLLQRAKANEKGLLKLELDLVSGTEIQLSFGKEVLLEDVYIEPGTVYSICQDDNCQGILESVNTESLVFGRMLRKKGVPRWDYQANSTSLFYYDLSTLKSVLNSKLAQTLYEIDRLSKNTSLSSKALQFYRNRAKYECLGALYYFSCRTDITPEDKAIALSGNYFKLDSVPAFDAQALDNPAYYEYLHHYRRGVQFWNNIKTGNVPASETWLTYGKYTDMALAADSVPEVRSRSVLYAINIEDYTSLSASRTPRGKSIVDSLLIRLEALSAFDPALYLFVRQNVDKLFGYTGKPVPELILKDRNGQTVDLRSKRGKVVLLDFWGTWCPPCIEAIPASTQLQQKMKGKNFEVITVCVRCEKEAWQKLLAEKGWPGTHLLNDPVAKLEEKFDLQSFPRYILVDKEGSIAVLHAYGPETEQLKGMIDSLLHE